MIHHRNLLDPRLLQGASWLPIPPDPGSSFSLRHLREKSFPFPFHYHPEMELTFILQGRGRRIIGEVVEPFREGDLVLVGSMLPHAWINAPGSESVDAYVLRFDGALLRSRLAQLPETTHLLHWLQRADRGLQWEGAPLLEVAFTRMMDAPSPARRFPVFLELLFALAEEHAWREICGEVGGGLLHGNSEQRIGYAVRYMLEHFDDELPQTEVAGLVGMQTSAFSRLFRRVTGRTFQETLLHLRISHACRLLTATDLSILDICLASGFRNLSNFNKQFRSLKKVSPRVFRSQPKPTQQ